jgi:crotonobetainyl-CoA:carnitine CoA-transferase CaiB-like acyl-CoA transferase
MTEVLAGIRVIEVAIYGMVPTAGAVLAGWGADVVKIEHARTGDPIRGLVSGGIKPGEQGISYLWEIFNRGKRGVGIDIAEPLGHDLLMRLVDGADVFLTNFLEPARVRLGIDVEHILGRNPRIIYGRGTGHGPRGPDAHVGGFDAVSFWCRTGLAMATRPAEYDRPIELPVPAFGDLQTGMYLAGGIAAALFRRSQTGEGAVVDASLVASGLWAMQAELGATSLLGLDGTPPVDRRRPAQPLTNLYRTRDDRWIYLSMLEADRYWPRLCAALGHPELAETPAYATAAARQTNLEACVRTLDEIFATRDLVEWKKELSGQDGQWSVIQTPREALEDEQAQANGYIQLIEYDGGASLPVVTPPVQFDEDAPKTFRAPAHGADTDATLGELGLTIDELLELKIADVIT